MAASSNPSVKVVAGRITLATIPVSERAHRGPLHSPERVGESASGRGADGLGQPRAVVVCAWREGDLIPRGQFEFLGR